jgi:hypothetical protein
MMRVIEGLAEDWHRLDQRIEELSSEIEELGNSDPSGTVSPGSPPVRRPSG